jgi:hypothetical protein
MQENKPGTWLARDGDGRVLEVDADGYPGAEASPGDGRPIAEAAGPPADREAWLKSYRAAVADLQQRNRQYLAARANDLAHELEAEAG